jgi:glycosyltransferase involved in cell wall biosynthesis
MWLEKIMSRLGPVRQHDLVIFDDIFPHPLSPFRLLEFDSYLEHFPRSGVYSTGGSFPLIGEKRSLKEVIEEHVAHHPGCRNQISEYRPNRRIGARLAYAVFLNNVDRFAETIARTGAALAFTLYPGGGFRLNARESDEKLRRVMALKSFRKVIVTQNVTREYLIKGNFCDASQIEFIYGGVFPVHANPFDRQARRRFGDSKDTLDICFVAHKYTPQGRDKGYDVFIEVARQCRATCPTARFHVVGPFTAGDVDTAGLENSIHFYGTQNAGFFPEFYGRMDIILSPNAPFLLAPGAFDGFPTGACIEAGMSGVTVLATDCLKQNIHFIDGKDIVIIPRDASAIAARISFFYQHPGQLYTLAEQGRNSFQRVFDLNAQMQPRHQMLERLLGQ